MNKALYEMSIDDVKQEMLGIKESLDDMHSQSRYPEDEFHPSYTNIDERYNTLYGYLKDLEKIDENDQYDKQFN